MFLRQKNTVSGNLKAELKFSSVKFKNSYLQGKKQFYRYKEVCLDRYELYGKILKIIRIMRRLF